MKIYTDNPEGVTAIQNSFIDQYMPHANGEFVKVYLYLLRCANNGRELSLSSIADVFEHTEKDVQRALTYWEKQKLISTRLLPDGTLESVTFVNPGAYLTPAVHEEKAGNPDGICSDGVAAYGDIKDVQEESEKSQEQTPVISQLSESARLELRELFLVAEQYLQRPLSSSEQNDFVYYYHTLKFSTDLIEYLLEYCITRGTTGRHYMRKVAQGWAEAGITTVQAAKKESSLYNKNLFSIMKAFGLKGRNPAPSEQEMMMRWINEYGFTMDLILEACRRTIDQTHEPSFKYADSILEQWHKEKVHSMEDVAAADRKWEQTQTTRKNTRERQRSASAGRFNNFSQRNYNYDNLEKKLFSQQ
ncbi:MAG: DnaD domain protein [Clostridiales bacterium]|nr:DnaD domain protein [Clostridiales bacterium]